MTVNFDFYLRFVLFYVIYDVRKAPCLIFCVTFVYFRVKLKFFRRAGISN